MSLAGIQIGARREGVGLVTAAEILLIGGIAMAVLAFGGTEPASFAVVEILYAGLAIVLLARWGETRFVPNARVAIVPGLLIGVALLQLSPLPITWVRFLTGGRIVESGARFGTLTIDPFATRVQLLILVTCVIGFLVAYGLGWDSARRRQFVTAIVVLGVFEALYGLAQYLTGWQHIFGYTKKFDLEEATGTYINRNHYAGLLEMILPFALALAFYESWKLQKKHHFRMTNLRALIGESETQKIVGWVAAAVVIFAALIFSRSRMGILAASTATFLLLGLMWSARMQRKTSLVLCGAFLVITASVAGWMGAGSVIERFQNVRQEYSPSNHSRLSIWRDTVRLIGRHPWLGTGLGTFPIAFTAVQTTFLNEFVNHAHNDYLELASDAGIPLAAAITASLLWLLARAVRAFHAGAKGFDRFFALGCTGSIAAMLLHSLVDFNLYIPANSMLFAAIAGLTASVHPDASVAMK